MYAVTVSRDFVAQHYLTVPDPGPEGELHSHRYEVAVRLSGSALNEFGYLVDIDDVRGAMDALDGRYRDATLNDLPEFGGNPSVERFARHYCERFLDGVDAPEVDRIRVTMREGDDAAASFERAV